MRLMMTLLAGAALATGAALPSADDLPGILPRPSVIHDGSCNDGPSVSAGEWALAREGMRRDGGGEPVQRPPVRSAVAMEADVSILGRREGTRFFHSGCRNGSTLKKLEIWGERGLEGIRMTFHDGEQFAAGSPKGCYESLDFEPSERITYLEQASDCGGKRYGNFKLRTSAKREFESRWGNDEGKVPVRYTFDVHSGFVCGMRGFQEDGVNALALLFSPKANSASLEVDPSSVPHGLVTFTDESNVFHFVNDGETPQIRHRYIDNRAFTYESTSGMSSWDGITVNALVEVLDGSVTPHDGTASEDAEFTIQRLSVAGGVHYGAFELPSVEFQDPQKFSVDLPKEVVRLEIPPHSECDFVVKQHVARADQAPWTGTATFFLDDDSSYSLPAGGILTGFDVVNHSIRRICFPSGKYNSNYSY